MTEPSHTHFRATRLLWIAAAVLTPLVLLAAVVFGFGLRAKASSHREAPAISKDAYADATDTYAFISPEDEDNVVFAASWIPFEGPEGGPNYYEWDPDALYDIYVDTDGDSAPNVTYTLSSRVDVVNDATFLYNVGSIAAPGLDNWNRRQYITITESLADGTISHLIANKIAAPVNIGSKSTPNYSQLEEVAIWPAAGGTVKLFAGQTDDAFWVDLQVFDLLTLRGQAAPVGYSQGNNIPIDSLSGFNVHSLVVEVPITRIKSGSEDVFGVWSGTRRIGTDVLNPGVQTDRQVSRLGMPLVNEVVLPYALKDAFNGLAPAQDLGLYTSGTPAGNLLQKSVEDPEVGRLLCNLYGVSLPGDADDNCSTEVDLTTPGSGRGDIFQIFLTGMKLAHPFTIVKADGSTQQLPAGFNVNQPAAVQPAEMLRINTAIKGDLCSPTPHRLGILGGDACGFPNGRRLTDDVVDIELLAVAGAAYGVLDARDAGFTFNADLIDVLDDGLDGNDVPFRSTFPYFALAQSGQEHLHQNPILAVYVPLLRNVALSVGSLPGAQPIAGVSLLFVALVTPALVWVRRSR